MSLHSTTNQYLVYLQASGMPKKRLNSYQRALSDIELFYGPDLPLDQFDNALVLEYVKENDPFESDPIKVQRGVVFCKFTHWLMKNHLIPAWAEDMRQVELENASVAAERKEDFRFDDNVAL